MRLAASAIPVSEILYVGDHPDDAQAAARAGTGFIAVLTGGHAAVVFATGTTVVRSMTRLVLADTPALGPA